MFLASQRAILSSDKYNLRSAKILLPLNSKISENICKSSDNVLTFLIFGSRVIFGIVQKDLLRYSVIFLQTSEIFREIFNFSKWIPRLYNQVPSTWMFLGSKITKYRLDGRRSIELSSFKQTKSITSKGHIRHAKQCLNLKYLSPQWPETMDESVGVHRRLIM